MTTEDVKRIKRKLKEQKEKRGQEKVDFYTNHLVRQWLFREGQLGRDISKEEFDSAEDRIGEQV
jgi:methionine aminopeptidase